MEVIVLFIVWLALSFVVGEVADRKGRSAGGWFLFCILLSPLVGAVAIALLPASEDGLINKGKMQRCPKCAEIVKAEATACRFCQAALSPSIGHRRAEPARGVKVAAVVLVIGMVGFAIAMLWAYVTQDERPAMATSSPRVVAASATEASNRLDVSHNAATGRFTVQVVRENKVLRSKSFSDAYTAQGYIEAMKVRGGKSIPRGERSAPARCVFDPCWLPLNFHFRT